MEKIPNGNEPSIIKHMRLCIIGRFENRLNIRR